MQPIPLRSFPPTHPFLRYKMSETGCCKRNLEFWGLLAILGIEANTKDVTIDYEIIDKSGHFCHKIYLELLKLMPVRNIDFYQSIFPPTDWTSLDYYA